MKNRDVHVAVIIPAINNPYISIVCTGIFLKNLTNPSGAITMYEETTIVINTEGNSAIQYCLLFFNSHADAVQRAPVPRV